MHQQDRDRNHTGKDSLINGRIGGLSIFLKMGEQDRVVECRIWKVSNLGLSPVVAEFIHAD
jgi:hypothetical protein